jgi:hypothetical protein
MITQYKNIDQIQTATKSVSATRLEKSKTDLLSYSANNRISQVPQITSATDEFRTEMHVYSGDSWITGNHKVQLQTKIPQYKDKVTNRLIKLPSKPIAIDLYNEFEKLKLTSGNFTVAVNFFKNLIGSYEHQHLRIDEISPDRTELRIRAIDEDNSEFLQQLASYIRTVSHTSTKIPYHKTYVLNFSRNQTLMFVNSVVIGEYIYIKLYEPLPTTIDVNFKCWVVEELKSPYVDRVSITPSSAGNKFNKLSNPNWQANASFNTSTETGLKNWNDLLGSSVQTSQQIVDAYFSGSLSGVKLNINYSDFNNFVFYSSATERLENFKYKLQLLEYYTSQSLIVSQLSGSVATTNAADYELNRTKLISGFDSFENYLYYQSSSVLTTYEVPHESPNVLAITGSYITPVPKTNSTVPYTLTSITSSQFNSWYNKLIATASLYDQLNVNSLVYTIPEFIRYDVNNEELSTFVNMLGHHYDILYTYINHMSRINKREENPKLGMPNELLYSVAKQFGWNLTDGNQYQDLWQYVLGTSETGTPLTGSNSVGDPSVPGREMTYAVWRRIVNNLPLLLKSKGTKRSVQALLSCYGIPQSMISINEYGGPRLERAPVYEKLNFDYALDLIQNPAGTATINYTQPINTVELRFRTDNVITNPTMSSTMNLFNIGSNAVTLDYSSGTMGSIQINGTSSADIEMFDGGWLTAMLRTTGSLLQVVAKRSKYGKIVAAVSASATASFATTGTVTLGSTSTGAARLIGQLQELRLWTSSLKDSAFNNHVKAPAAYDANIDAYSELVFRLPLTQKINHSATSSLIGVEPNASNISASFTSWTNNTPYDSIEETYYYDAPALGAGSFDDNKIRLEENDLVGTLDVKTRAERSQFDKAPLDSKKLGVYFSPQTMIDEDIIAQFGYADLDQYIGDPGATDEKSYPRLIQAAQNYWKKYSTRNDINAYINMFTLFDLSFFKQLEQLLPARTDKLLGILIQPNLLERSKDKILPEIKRYDSGYTVIIDNIAPTSSGDYLQYLGTVDGKILDIVALDDDQWQMYITASSDKKYNGTTYSYSYLIPSASTWITASTPEWRSEAVAPVILSARSSEYQYASGSVTYSSGSVGASTTFGTGIYGTSTYYLDPIGPGFEGILAQVQDYLPTGIRNQRYDGAKISSPRFNVNSTQTVDGGPVVEFRSANANQLIYQQNGEQGSFVLV